MSYDLLSQVQYQDRRTGILVQSETHAFHGDGIYGGHLIRTDYHEGFTTMSSLGACCVFGLMETLVLSHSRMVLPTNDLLKK
jgi:hypothetical protein